MSRTIQPSYVQPSASCARRSHMSRWSVAAGCMLKSQTPDSSCDGYPLSALSLGENIVNCPGRTRSARSPCVSAPATESSAVPPRTVPRNSFCGDGAASLSPGGSTVTQTSLSSLTTPEYGSDTELLPVNFPSERG